MSTLIRLPALAVLLAPALSSVASAGEGTHWGVSLTPFSDFNRVTLPDSDSCTNVDDGLIRDGEPSLGLRLNRTGADGENVPRVIPEQLSCDGRVIRPSIRAEMLLRREVGTLASLRFNAGAALTNVAGSVSWNQTDTWSDGTNPVPTGYAGRVDSLGATSLHFGLNLGVDALYDFYQRGSTPYVFAGVQGGAGVRAERLGARGSTAFDEFDDNDMEYWWTADAAIQCADCSPLLFQASIATMSVGGRFGIGYRTASEHPLFFEAVYGLAAISGGSPANYPSPAAGVEALRLNSILLNTVGLTVGLEFD